MSGSYSDQLVVALRLRDVPGQRIGEVVAEVEAYTVDSGQDPVEAFGSVDVYSDDIAAQSRRTPSTRRWIREILGAYPAAIGSLVLVDGLWGVARGEQAALSFGGVAFAAVLPLAVLLLVAAVTRARRWAYGAAVSVGVAGTAVLWTSSMIVLVRYPAWIGVAAGVVLLAIGLGLVRRDPVIDPRDGRDRYPMSGRSALLAVGPTLLMLALLVAAALLAR